MGDLRHLYPELIITLAVINAMRNYLEIMIKSFRCKETQGIFERRRSTKFGQFQEIALRKLLLIEAATVLDDLRIPPANRHETLKRGRAVQYSIRINDQWRICFEWREGHAFKVESVDYH